MRRKGLLKGIKDTVDAVSLTAKGVFYKETPQVRGRIGRAFAHQRKGGKGKIGKRPSFIDDLTGGIKQKRRQDRGRIAKALARNTKGGSGRIEDRRSYKRHLP